MAAWWRANAWGLGFCWLLAFLAHGAFLASPTLTVDEELYPISDQTEWFLVDGRWVLWAFKSVTAPLGLAPYQCTFLALLLIGLSAWFAASALEHRSDRRYLPAALFATSPVLVYIVTFTFSASGVLFGLACATGACLLARRAHFRLDSRAGAAGCAALVWLGLAAYQSLGLVYVTFACLYCLRRALGLEPSDAPGAGRALGFVAATGAMGLAVHLGVDIVVKLVRAIPLVRPYQVEMFEWGRAGALDVAWSLARDAGLLFRGAGPVVGAFTRWLPWLGLGVGLAVAARRGRGGGRPWPRWPARAWLPSRCTRCLATPCRCARSTPWSCAGPGCTAWPGTWPAPGSGRRFSRRRRSSL